MSVVYEDLDLEREGTVYCGTSILSGSYLTLNQDRNEAARKVLLLGFQDFCELSRKRNK